MFVNTHAPLRTKRVRSRRSPWITSELKKRMHERDIMKLKATRSKNPQDWGEFKRLYNKVNSNIQIAKESYYKQSFTEHIEDSRRTWQTIKEITSRKSNTSSIKELTVNAVSINKTTVLTNAFNEHFPQLAPNMLMRYRRQLTATNVVLNILTSLTKDSVLLRQIAVKYFHMEHDWANPPLHPKQ